MAFTQIISNLSAGEQVEFGFPTLTLTAIGAFAEGWESLVSGRKGFVRDAADLRGSADFLFVVDYPGTPSPIIFGGEFITTVLGAESLRTGYPTVRNLDFLIDGIGAGVNTVFGETLVHDGDITCPINFDFIESMQNRWGGQLPIQFGTSAGDLVFVQGVHDPGFGTFLIQKLGRRLYPEGFEVSIQARRWYIHPLPAPLFHFGPQHTLEPHPALNFVFGGSQLHPSRSADPMTRYGGPTVRLLDHNAYMVGGLHTEYGVTIVARPSESIGIPAAYGLDFVFLYTNTHAQYGTNTAFYFFATKYVDPVGLNALQVGNPTVTASAQDLHLLGFETLQVGNPRIVWLKVNPSGLDSLGVGTPQVRNAFKTIYITPFGVLAVGSPSVEILTTAEVSGFVASLYGTPALDNSQQFLRVFGSLFTQFGSPSLPLEQQFVNLYGSRTTQWGTASVTNAIDVSIQPASWLSAFVPINHKVELDTRYVLVNTGADVSLSFGQFDVSDLLPVNVEPEGIAPPVWEQTGVDDEFFVSHWFRYMNFAGRGPNTLSVPDHRIYHKYTYVSPEWMMPTAYGYPTIVRWLEVKPNGYPYTEIGLPTVDYSGTVFWDSIYDPAFGDHSVRLNTKFVTFREQDAFLEFGDFETTYLRSYIFMEDPLETNPPPFNGGNFTIGNYDRALLVPGALMFKSSPYNNLVSLAATAVAPPGIPSLETSKPMVSHAVRYLLHQGHESSWLQPLQPALHNAAFAAYPVWELADTQYGAHTVWGNRQWLDFTVEGIDGLDAGGASLVSYAIRTITQTQIDEPSTKVGSFYIGLQEQFIEPTGFMPALVGAPGIIGPFFTTITPRPMNPDYGTEDFGAPVVANVNRTVYLAAAWGPDWGYPKVFLFTRNIYPSGFESFTVERSDVSWADRTLWFPGGVRTGYPNIWSVRNTDPGPPAEQRVVFDDCGQDSFNRPNCRFRENHGTFTIRRNGIVFTEDDMEVFPDVRFGNFQVYAHTIQIIQSWDNREFGVPWVGDNTQFIDVSSEDDDPIPPSRIYMKPRYIFMRTDDLEYAYYRNLPPGEQDGRWAPLDETGQHAGWTATWVKGGFGNLRVSHRVRYLLNAGGGLYWGQIGQYGKPTFTLGTGVITPDSISSLSRGWVTIFPHTIRLFMGTHDSLVFGGIDNIWQEWVDPRFDQTIYMSGSVTFSPGALDPQKLNREVYPSSWTDTVPTQSGHPLYPPHLKVWGNNTPMVYHYPRGFAVTGYDATEYGLTWVSHHTRPLEMTWPDDWTAYYHPGMIWTQFNFRMAVRNLTDDPEDPTVPVDGGVIKLSGRSTQVVGAPSVYLKSRDIHPYMIPPPCVIGIYEVDHA